MWKTYGITSLETTNKAPLWDNPRSLFILAAETVDITDGIIFVIHKVMNILEILQERY